MLENMKRIKTIRKGFALALLITAWLFAPQTASAETAVWDGSMIRPTQGSGTANDPFLINTAEEMAYLIANYDYNSGICYRKFYKLTRNLDMKSTQWTFGYATADRKSFRAHFDGGGHKISNIEINLQDTPKECHYGLFPQLGGDAEFESVIENLEIENIHFVRNTGDANGTYNWRIGGLVGQMYSNSRIANCIVHGFSVTDYGADVNMRPRARISACPLVGDIQHKFGETDYFHRERGVMIESCYGHGVIDLSHFHGKEGQAFQTDVQGSIREEGYSYNGYEWHALNETDRSFSMMTVDVTPAMSGTKFQYEGFFNRERGHTYTFRWMLDGKRIGTNSSSVISVEPKPYVQRLGLTLYDNGKEAGSGAILIEPDQYNLAVDSITAGSKKNMHNVYMRMSTESGLDVGEDDFTFSWTDMTDGNKEVSTEHDLKDALDGHTYLCVATHREHAAAKFSFVQSFSHPIYVCNRGINEFEASYYTNDNKVYPQGHDSNDGLSPESAVKTLKRAYELLDMNGSVGSNVIIIMGEYADFDFTEFYDNRCTRRNPNFFVKDRPALITGRSKDFRNGRLLFAGLSIKLNAETRFEQINLHGTSFEITELTDQAKVFACGNDLTMGYGITINGYKSMDFTLGMSEGVFVPTITLYGGVLNNNDPQYVHPENTITILSGTYGRVIAGDGYTLQMEKTGNISGSPQRPIRTHIVCDVANYFDPYHSQYDVSLIIGGQADGTIFADTKIDVKGTSRVGRIVGGNVAFGRAMPGRPADSFFGQNDITIHGGSVTEICGTNLGRYGHILYPDELDHDSCVTYFYGRSNINLLGGILHNTSYGGGAADVVGLGYDSAHHTLDPHIPYWSDGKIAFGTYDQAVGKMPIMQLRDSALDLSHTELHVNIGGDIRILGSIYGGSLSNSSLLPTRQAGSQSGCIFGDTYINMTGGYVDGYIYGGCRGNLTYFENSDNSSYPIVNGVQMDRTFFNRMGQLYGNTHVSVTGGEVYGMIYGGGEGTYYRETSKEDLTNAVDLVGTVYGSTNVTIGGDAIFHKYVFGAGNYSHVLRTGMEKNPATAGLSKLDILGGNMYAAVFGAGHGNKDSINDARSIYAKVAGDVVVNMKGGKFLYNDQMLSYINRNLYGVCAGGVTTSKVYGDTYLTIATNPYTEELKQNKTILPEEDFVMCAGGYEHDCDVLGTSHLIVDIQDTARYQKMYAGGFYAKSGNSSLEILNGNLTSIYAGGYHGDVTGNAYTFVKGGKVKDLYGGSFKANIGGETFIEVGTDDEAANEKIAIETIYGGNEDEECTVNGSKDATGCHVTVKGGSVTNVSGAVSASM